VLLHLYGKHGRHFLERNEVNGMFAFAIYDEDEDYFIVARDPVGIIPLYMGWGSDGSLWFGASYELLHALRILGTRLS